MSSASALRREKRDSGPLTNSSGGTASAPRSASLLGRGRDRRKIPLLPGRPAGNAAAWALASPAQHGLRVPSTHAGLDRKSGRMMINNWKKTIISSCPVPCSASPACSASRWLLVFLKGVGLLSNRAGNIHQARQCQRQSVACEQTRSPPLVPLPLLPVPLPTPPRSKVICILGTRSRVR